jgi:hypothetical protein
MLIGQLFLIMAIGKIVAAWRPGRWSTVGTPDEHEGKGALPCWTLCC